MKRNRVIMVYPHQGFSGTYVKHMPLSLLYASSEIVKHGFDVRILDTRTIAGNWQDKLRELINENTLCVGVSVMSGYPIKHAIAIGRFVKTLSSETPVIWGGPHATSYPETILRDEWSADYVVSGYAAHSFHQLCLAMQEGRQPEGVEGILWRQDGGVRVAPLVNNKFEFIDYRDIPYHLIEDYSAYGQLGQDKRIFSMYSAMGCPYQCTFCTSPAQYRTIEGKKWVPYETQTVIDHVAYVVEKHDANYIYFIDDDSFPSLKHVEAIIDGIRERNLPVRLGFRGARINEIKRMSNEFLDKLAASGTDIMHIGAESGSDRILKMLRKDSSYADIIECNRKLARHPTITAAYNFIVGVPSETLDDLKRTRDLMLQLVAEHPNCIIFPPNKFRPLPGTELFKVAQEIWGYSMPNTLDAWAEIEVEKETLSRWFDKRFTAFCNLLLICSYFIDGKAVKLTGGNTWFVKFLRLAHHIYQPVARFRLKRGLSQLLIEQWIFKTLTNLISIIQARL